jgi:O-antigen ligase
MLLKGTPLQTRASSWLIGAFAVILGIATGTLIVYFNNPLYVLVGLISLIGFVAAVVSVEFGLLLLVFITYTRFSDIAVHTYNAPSVAKSFVVMLLIAICIRWVVANERPRGILMPALIILGYGMVGFTSLLYAPDQVAVINSLSNFVKDAIIALVVIALLKKPIQFRHVIYTLLVIGVFIGTISVHQHLTGNFEDTYGGFAMAEYMNIVEDTDNYRLSGPVGDPNFFAQVMVVLALLGMERLLNEKNLWLKILAGWVTAVSTLTVVFTYSRGGTVALVLAVALFFMVYKLKPAQVLVVLTLGIVMLLFAPSNYYERILTLEDILPTRQGEINVRDDRAIQGRASENLTAWVMIMDRPLLGVGLSNFSYRYQEYSKSLGLAPSARNRSPHNLYLEVAAETGIVGLAVFLGMLALAFRSILHSRRRFQEAGMDDYANLVTGFAIAFSGYLLAALFVHASYPRYFYLLIGIAFSLSYVFEESESDDVKADLRD